MFAFKEALTILSGMELLTVMQVAAIMNVTVGAVYSLVNAKPLEHYRIGISGGAIRIDRADVERYLAEALVPQHLPGFTEKPLRSTKTFTGFTHLGRGSCRPKL